MHFHAQCTNSWIEMALTVTSDSPNIYEETDTTAGFNFERSELFSEVWSGDAYNKSGVDGLKALLKELEDILNNMNRKRFLDQAKKLVS
jgi:chloramphenicol O-acetyltransferase